MMAQKEIEDQTQTDEDEKEKELSYELIQHVNGFRCDNCHKEGNIALVEYQGKEQWQTRQGLLCLDCKGQEVTRICDDPTCKSERILFDDHHCELYCGTCGLVLGQAPPLYAGDASLDPVWFILIKRLTFTDL